MKTCAPPHLMETSTTMDAHWTRIPMETGYPMVEDLCAETPVTESADSNGCSASQKDTDGDGISDSR